MAYEIKQEIRSENAVHLGEQTKTNVSTRYSSWKKKEKRYVSSSKTPKCLEGQTKAYILFINK